MHPRLIARLAGFGIATAIAADVRSAPYGGGCVCLGLSWSATDCQWATVGESGRGARSLTTRLPHAGQNTGMRATESRE